jgi:hypothetical protein
MLMSRFHTYAPMLATLGIALGLSGCAAPMRARRLAGTPGTSQTRGFAYYLPRTVVSASVPVVRNRWTPGRYSDLLPYFFPCLENTAGADPRPYAPPACGEVKDDPKFYTTSKTVFSLEEPSIRTASERDPEQIFTIDYKSRWFQWFVDRKFGLDLSEEGVAGKVSAEAHDRTGEVIGQVLQSGAAVFARALTSGIMLARDAATRDAQRGAGLAPACDGPPLTVGELEFARYLSQPDQDFFCRLPAAAREEYVAMSLVLRSKFRAYMTPATGPIDSANSRLLHFLSGWAVFKRIAHAGELRATALSSDMSKDTSRDALESRIKAIDDSAARDIAGFFGASQQRIAWTGLFEIRNTTARALDLFGLDEQKGICAVAVDPTVTVVNPLPDGAPACAAGAEITRLHLASVDAPPASLAASGGNTGFFYRIPGVGRAEVRQDDRTLLARRIAVAQFGVVAAMPESTGGRRSAVTAELYSASGALKTVAVTSDAAIDKALFTSAQAAATTTIDALAAAKAAATPAPADELKELERKRKILEEKLKIQQLEQQVSGRQP